MAKFLQKSKKRGVGTRDVAGKRKSAGTKSVRLDRDTDRAIKIGPVSVDFKTISRFMVPTGHVDVDKVATEFKVTKASLAQSLGLAEETLQRSARASAQKTQQRLREMLEILARVEPWAGGMPQAMGWYRGQGIPALGDQTAEALVRNDQAAVVRAYLHAIAAGAFA
jgi:hypothetical protein